MKAERAFVPGFIRAAGTGLEPDFGMWVSNIGLIPYNIPSDNQLVYEIYTNPLISKVKTK